MPRIWLDRSVRFYRTETGRERPISCHQCPLHYFVDMFFGQTAYPFCRVLLVSVRQRLMKFRSRVIGSYFEVGRSSSNRTRCWFITELIQLDSRASLSETPETNPALEAPPRPPCRKSVSPIGPSSAGRNPRSTRTEWVCRVPTVPGHFPPHPEKFIHSKMMSESARWGRLTTRDEHHTQEDCDRTLHWDRSGHQVLLRRGHEKQQGGDHRERSGKIGRHLRMWPLRKTSA